MPQWGLDEYQRRCEPWGIPEKWLRSGKVITDPIHGDVYLNQLEQAIVDSSSFQRLRRIRQLGTVHFVYPGGTHTRFAHALGALRIVQDLLDIILAQRAAPHPRHDLFMQWSEGVSDPHQLRRKFAETIVLARLGALLHDLCHIAYGHSIEDDLEILDPHDMNTKRFVFFWKQLGDGDSKTHAEVQQLLNRRLKEPLEVLILSKRKVHHPETEKLMSPDERLRMLSSYPFVADMVGNTICADLIDYLERDHRFTGLPAALGKRFMSAFYVVPKETEQDSAAVLYPERMALRIKRGDRERKDVVSELLKYLRFRYELQERALVHHAKLAADAMLGKMLELWHDAEWIMLAEQQGGAEVADLLEAGSPTVDAVRAALIEDTEDKKLVASIDRRAGDALEGKLRQVGDDGLLEYLRDSTAEFPEIYGLQIRQLAADLLARRLYKRAAQATGALARQEIYERFGTRGARKRLERAAARYAGLDETEIVIWLPEPRMRLKIAEVLVDYGPGIAPFAEYSDQGKEIYDAHRRLWTVTVFIHPSARKKGKEPIVLAKLAELMEIEWDRHKPRNAKQPADWPRELVAEVAEADFAEEELQEMIKAAQQIPNRQKDPPFKDQLKSMRAYVKRGLKSRGKRPQ
jgi:HD superfamily phosphohydrolase